MKWARFFWRYVSYRSDLGLALLLCALVVAAAELSIPYLIAQAIDTVLGEETRATLDTWVLWMLGILCGLYVVHAILLRIEARMLLESAYNLRRRLYTHIHSQSLAFFQRHKTGKLMHRVTSDAGIFDEGAYEIFSDLPFSLLTVMGVLVMMAYLDVRLMGLVVLFLTLTGAVTGYLGRPLPSIRKSIQRIAAGLSGRLQESLVGVRTVKAFRNEPHELRRLDDANRKILKAGLQEGKLEALIDPLFDLMEILGVVLVVWYGGHLILDQQITPGTLVAFITYMEILAGPIGRAGSYYRNFQTCRAVGERLQDLLDDRSNLPSSGGRTPAGEHWTIECEDVSFRYPGRPGEALKGVSFRVEPGASVSVVGRNGAGKSTMLDLLLRFYDPTQGRIQVGGLDLKAWDLEAWRGAVGMMPQDVFLFHGTIAENVGYGRMDATLDEIERAIREAGAEPLVNRLADGLETEVGERGTTLSSGERQLIALARLFLRNPRVLILDEPTSHLDGEVLRRVTVALKRLMVGRTTFVIAHDPETIQLANRVVLLERGRLVADATHETLLSDNVIYRALLEEMGHAANGA